MAIARALLVDIASNTAKIRQDIAKVKGDFVSLGKTFGTLAKITATVFSVQQVLAYAKEQINLADNLYKSSQKIGVSVEALSAYHYAAGLAGGSTEDVTHAIMKLSVNLREALINPASDSALALREIGVSAAGAQGELRSTQSVFEEIAKKFSEMQGGSNKTALAMKLFGRSGAELIPLLDQLQELKKEAEAAGAIISTEFAKNAEAFNDNLKRMETSLAILTRALLSNVVPALNEMFERLNVKIGAQAKLSLDLLERDRANLAIEYTRLSEHKKLRESLGEGGGGLVKQIEHDKVRVRAEIDRVDSLLILSNKELEVKRRLDKQRAQSRPTMPADPLTKDVGDILSSMKSENEKFEEIYINRMDTLEEARERELLTKAQFNTAKETLELEHRARMKDVVAQNELDALKVVEMSTQGQIQSMLQRGIGMTAAVATSSKKMFALNKTLALANAALSLPDAVMGAYAWGARIGGPLLGAAMGTLAGAAQLAQIGQIKSASFGTATSAASVGGGSAIPITNADAGAIPGPTTQSNLPTQNITVNVQNGTGDAAYWQELIDSVIVPGLGDAQRRNVNLTIR